MHENDFFNEDLLCALAGVAGEDNVLMSEPMRDHTTFKIGGPADVFVTPDTEQGLVATLDTCYRCDLPLTIVGNGSDLLVGDKGIRGVVVALGEGLSDITVDGTHVTAAAGALLSDVATAAAEAGLTGMEPISGIPGSVGGACYMNAGAYGACMADVLESVRVYKPAHVLDDGTRGSENLGIALSHELLDVVGKTAQHGLDLLLLGLHVLHLSSLLVLELLQVGLLRLELGLLRIELFLNGLDILDGIAVALVDLLDVVRVGNELLKRTRGQQQRQNVGAARLIAGRNAIGKIAALLFELGLLLVNLRLCVVDLTLHALDIVEGLGILVGQRSVFICDAVELGLDLIELGLGRIEFVGGLLGGLGRMGAGGQTKKNGRRSGAEQGLKGGTARKLLGKDGIAVW